MAGLTKEAYKKQIKRMVDSIDEGYLLVRIYTFVKTLSKVAPVQQEEKECQ